MPLQVGEVTALYRYPVKSMMGERLAAAMLGWHGLDGDRRLALRRVGDHGGFPWLTASRLPELLRYAPVRRDAAGSENLPSHIRTPDGRELPLLGEELAGELGHRHGSPVEVVHLRSGIFDEASVSVISAATVDEVARLAARSPDARRFRPNILVATTRPVPSMEDDWVGGVLRFGDAHDGAAVAITQRDVRCAMVNLDPDSARPDPEVLKAIVRARNNTAGVYGTVVRCGRIAAGQPVFLEPMMAEHRAGARDAMA